MPETPDFDQPSRSAMTLSLWLFAWGLNFGALALLMYFTLPSWSAGVIGALMIGAFHLGRASR